MGVRLREGVAWKEGHVMREAGMIDIVMLGLHEKPSPVNSIITSE